MADAVPRTFDHTSDIQTRVTRGVRTTFLLSLLSVPVGYLTQIFLARTSTEAVGIFGAVVLWSTFAQSFYYFGGNAVVIRYFPGLASNQQSQFLRSYTMLLLALTVPGVFLLFRTSLHSKLTTGTLANFSVALYLAIALVNVYQQLYISALKAMLDLEVAQVLSRVTTLGQFGLYGVMFFFGRKWFLSHLVLTIIAGHLFFVGLSLLLAVYFLFRRLPVRSIGRLWRFPPGFWKFSFLTELSTLVSFLYGRIDQVVVLIYASISGLGIYYVLSQLSSSIQLLSTFFLDSIFPAIASVHVRLGAGATRQLYRRSARINQLIVTGSCLVILSFHSLVLATFGRDYRNYSAVLIVLVAFSGLNSLGTLNAFTLTGTGKIGMLIWSQSSQVLAFVALFGVFHGGDSLLRLALAQGVAMTLGLLVTIIAVRIQPQLRIGVPREFWASAAAISGTVLFLLKGQRFGSIWSAAGLFIAAFGLFLLLGGYTRGELASLLAFVHPSIAPSNVATRQIFDLSADSDPDKDRRGPA
ncbi:MAG TPA: hypothetical protein VFO34_03820 [Candidatus Acidoferrales bacterium]|nr:hypothetical protein [Candidatus Acidoferrales bacterium]